ncbi:Phosphoglycerate mutase-like protein 1 [Durusdinium trenchii]|uniref:Phosphoglycerate mutase-like protein 1 n=1 Tax=Durusdinium trenchii TaxID=1381693 RepID=A0ABP0RPJ0_9DINO
MSKRVALIRHGHSEHNYSSATSLRWLGHLFGVDRRLTAAGREQAEQLGEEVRSSESHTLRTVEVVISSPLSRALETTLLIFGESPRRCVSHLHTERCIFPCDTGSSKEELLTRFPSLESWEGFQELPDEWWPKDSLWTELTPTARVEEFKHFLLQRPEAVLAVVGHSGFFRQVVGRKMQNCEVVWLELTPDAVRLME